MTDLTGFIEAAAPGAVRVYWAADPARFSDVDCADVLSFRRSEDDMVGVVTLKPGASVTEGTLDQTSFAALFAGDGRPHLASVFHRETSFKLCYSWNPPGGGGYC
jgi:hypothetical protein